VEKTSRPGPRKHDDPSVIAMVTRAAGSDQSAWNEIVERYAPLVWSICCRFQLSSHDSEDVGQTVWLLLVEHLGELREAAALPGWLATTTAHECLRVVTAARRAERLGTGLDDAMQFADAAVIDEEILIAERNAGLRAAFADLPLKCQHLLALLLSDPPCSYAEISATLDIPLGSIGPQRGRCLNRLRRSPALKALVEGDVGVTVPGGEPGA
jgi:RNA polymerase sigma factor (sigma-70 family)